MFLFTVYAVNC